MAPLIWVYPSSTMQSDGDSGPSGPEAQLASKERARKELQAARVHQLEMSLGKAQEECACLRERYQQLREDFQFNLALLDERGRELERYDVITARALTVEHNRQEELNQLRMQINKLEERRARETEERQEELSKAAAQHRLQLDKLKRSMAGEIQKQTEECERRKWDLQCRIQEVEGELTLQRQEMTAAFDSELRQRQHEFNLKMEEMRAGVLSHDLKVKLLSKETEVHCQAQLQAAEALEASQEFCQQTQTELHHKEQEVKRLTAVKDCRVKELEDELQCMKTRLKEEESHRVKKYEDVVRALKECDAQLEAKFQANVEQMQKTEKHIVKLQENMEVLAAQERCKQEERQKAVEQNDETIQRYKQQLSAGLKREKASEQMRVQVELEWQRRCEDMKAEHYLASEQLIQDLTQARDQAKAELKEKEQELQDLTVLLRSVKTERDQAVQGLTPKVDSLASEEIRRLQEQNSILRAVISQMRTDMEGLSQLSPHPQASSPQPVQHPEAPAATSIAPAANAQMAADYTQALEQEVSRLKARCRHLKELLEGVTRLPSLAPAADKPTEDLAPKAAGGPVGGRCPEKCTCSSAVTKPEARVAHTESAVANIVEQSALVRRLREENLHLRRQRWSAPTSGDLFEKVQGAESTARLLHIRLKQAALCIGRLSREKQQLIEMGNRLRAQITTAGLREPERGDSSTEKPGDQPDRMSALEQLQYQLTTQELQYALRQRACTFAEQLLPGTNSRGPATKEAANPWCQGHKSTDRPESSKNEESSRSLSQSQSSLDVGPEPPSGLSRSRLSSEESLRLLKELWEKLDRGLSPSLFSEGEGELSKRELADSGGSGVQMMVHGISAPIHSQPPTEVQQRRNLSTTPSNTTKTSRPGAPGRISKIRNYNVKD